MKDDPQEFEKLRRLLALKRSEVPPPRYFNSFSSEVISQIKAGEAVKPGMWRQLTSLFVARPAISWSFSVAAVLLLFVASNAFEGQPDNQAGSFPSLVGPLNPRLLRA